MTSLWTRLGIVAGILAAAPAAASALARPDLVKNDTFKCGRLKNSVCGATREDSE